MSNGASYFGATIGIEQPVWETRQLVSTATCMWLTNAKQRRCDNSRLIRLDWSANEFHVMIQNAYYDIGPFDGNQSASHGCRTHFAQSIYL